jgi:hypothetical protein
VRGDERLHSLAECAIRPARLRDEGVALVGGPVQSGVEQLIDLAKPLA